MSRFRRLYDQEDEAARLLRRPRGSVAVYSDGSVCWYASAIIPNAISIPCPLPDRAARTAYTGALREWFNRDQLEKS